MHIFVRILVLPLLGYIPIPTFSSYCPQTPNRTYPGQKPRAPLGVSWFLFCLVLLLFCERVHGFKCKHNANWSIMADSNACQNYKHYYQQKQLCMCWDLLVLLSICSISGVVVSTTYRTWKTSPACLGLLGWLCGGDVHCFLLVAGGYHINWPMSNVPNCDHSGTLFTALIKLANSIESSFLWIHNFTLNRGLQ